jgi:PAS domain S-box-containing protein
MELLKNLFSSDGFIPHGHCLLWKSSALWLHVVSDSLITLAYYSISIILLYFVRRRRDLAFPWMFLMFGAFIFGCGTTHLMGVWTLWVPTYWLDGVIKAATAFFSLATAVLLVQLVPKALVLRSPAELKAANRELERQITEIRRVEEDLQKARDELETRVQERTVELSKSNEELKKEIGERKKAEEDLRESREQLREITENIGDVFWMTDPDLTQVQYLSPSYERVWGRTCEGVYKNPLSWAEAIHRDDRERVLTAVPEMKRGNYDETYRIIRPDGTIRWIHDRAVPVYNESGEVYRIAGIAEDITERKKAEEKIGEQAELLNKAQDAIIVRDLEDHILFCNERTLRLYGLEGVVDEPGDLNGKTINDLLYKQDSSHFAKAKKITLEKGEWSGELSQTTKDGKEVVVESHWSLIRDNMGKPKSILAINTDVTGKRALQAQFLRAQRVESIGTLAGGIAHDLNNVLHPITMALQLLRKRFTDEKSQSWLDTLETSSLRGANLVKQVLSFARGLKGEHTILQIRHLILEIERILGETFPKSIQIDTEVPKDLWTVYGDPTQLHQVLMNLCLNARDAITGSGRLSISAENIFIDENYARMNIDAKVGPYVVITVSDTGAGIPPGIMDRIFEPFFTTKEVGEGTGLGLSTAFGIVKTHGGFLHVYSEVGRGTRFRVYLPAIETTEVKRADEKRGELPRGHGELILVVDDEASSREITRATLETQGYSVITANDGAEAVALYAQHREELGVVLMDMVMPIMDGPAAIRAVSQIDPQVKVIAVSGIKKNDKLAKVTGVDVCAFLTKPYTAEQLLKTLHKVLSTR